jgi:hypothetical protein
VSLLAEASVMSCRGVLTDIACAGSSEWFQAQGGTEDSKWLQAFMNGGARHYTRIISYTFYGLDGIDGCGV